MLDAVGSLFHHEAQTPVNSVTKTPAHVTSGVTPIRHVLKELKNERGSRRRENSLGLGWEAMLPRTPRTATTLRCTWREAQARTRKSGVVGEVGRLSHGSGRGVRMPPTSEHSGEGGGVGWGVGLGEWVGVSIVTSEFVTSPEKKQARKVHTHILHGCFSFKAVDFSVASKKKRLPLFQTTSVFPPFAPERFISNLTHCVSNFIVFSQPELFFQPWRFFQPHGMGNGSVFFQLCDFPKPKTPKT